jgi:hypothetical protein
VKHTRPIVRDHDEDKQNPEGRRGHAEKLEGRGLGQMVVQERSPGLGGAEDEANTEPPSIDVSYLYPVRSTTGF